MKKYSVTKAADRAAMVRMVTDILGKATGGTITPREYCGKREVGIEFTCPRGLSVSVSFDGDDRMDREGTFCMAWHTLRVHVNGEYRRDALYSEAFGSAMQAPVNSYHFGKCTAFGDGFDDLCVKLERATAAINDGTAYRA